MEDRQKRHVRFRSKRTRYALRACEECKRRKVKCDGKEPCTRCAGQAFGCEYATSKQKPSGHESMSAQQYGDGQAKRSNATAPMQKTQRFEHVTPTPSGSDAIGGRGATIEHRPLPEFSTNSLEFCGPSSTEYTFNAVNGNLRALGMPSAIPDKHSGLSIPSSSTGRLMQYGPFFKLLTMDPLWDMTQEDALVLIDDWMAGLGTVYPIVSRRALIDAAEKVFGALDMARSEGLRERGGSVAEELFNHNTNKLKIVLAIGIVKRAGGRQHQAERLFQSTSEAVEGLIWNPEGIHGIQLLILVGTYHYHLDEEVRTGRCIAFAARLCLEAGLHRRATLDKLSQETSGGSEALQAFWVVYMYERRLSLAQGIPFSIQDSYVDKSLYTIKISNPLLPSLLQWTKLAGKTWHLLNSQVEKTYDSKVEDINYLDYQIMEWFNNLPEHLRLAQPARWTRNQEPTYMQSVIFVRQANLRNLIYRPVLQSPAQYRQNEASIQRAIDISKDTVRTLSSLNDYKGLLFSHPMFFQPLLLTAFGTLLLAVINAGPEIRNSVHIEFNMYLHIFQLLSSRCTALRRTWRRLQGLRDLHAKLSHSDHNASELAPHSEDIATNDSLEGPLSFDDIFPDMPALASLMSSSEPCAQFGHNSGAFQDFSHFPEDLLDSQNLFNFPFPSLMSLP